MLLANDIMPPDKRFDSLLPVVAELARRHQLNCWLRHGIQLRITETYRSQDRQALLYAQGRKLADLGSSVLAVVARNAPEWLSIEQCPGDVVTWTLKSKHSSRKAYDTVPIVEGHAVWDEDALWNPIGQEGEALGLEWGGRWNKPDKPHFQLNIK